MCGVWILVKKQKLRPAVNDFLPSSRRIPLASNLCSSQNISLPLPCPTRAFAFLVIYLCISADTWTLQYAKHKQKLWEAGAEAALLASRLGRQATSYNMHDGPTSSSSPYWATTHRPRAQCLSTGLKLLQCITLLQPSQDWTSHWSELFCPAGVLSHNSHQKIQDLAADKNTASRNGTCSSAASELLIT